MRQMAILLLSENPEKHLFVRDLAATISISKPGVCRALDTLGIHGYAKRVREDNDQRNVYAQITDEGRRFLASIR